MSGNSSYPISSLISDLIAHPGGETAFVKDVLGYQDLESGTSRLRRWLVDDQGPNSTIKAISWATECGSELQDAIHATERTKHEEAEAAHRRQCEAEAGRFQSFLTAIIGTEVAPSPLCSFQMTGGHARWTIIRIPRHTLELSVKEQAPALRPSMQRYRRKYKARVPFWRPLRGFRLVRLLDYLSFTPDGDFIRIVDKPFRFGSTTLSL